MQGGHGSSVRAVSCPPRPQGRPPKSWVPFRVACLNWLPPRPALEWLYPEENQKRLVRQGLVELLRGAWVPGGPLLSAFYS